MHSISIPGNASFSQAIQSKLRNKEELRYRQIPKCSQIELSVAGLLSYVLLAPSFPSEHTKLKNILLLDEIHLALIKAG